MKNIILVGFMGTGKTAVAKELACQMNRAYVSIDNCIEAREKKVIKDIFRDDGEPYFRKVEKEVVKEVTEKQDQIVDTGGGVVLDSDNMDNLRRGGVIICLWTEVQTVYDRTKRHGHRPLLNVENPTKKIKELLDYRRPFYEKADFHIDTSDFKISEIVDQIMRIAHEQSEKK